jgi:D-alanyl-D-alanine carboxypeptidase/D-alanyl-D-alanine-endopeptidase (penicillin-binding protein 4)
MRCVIFLLAAFVATLARADDLPASVAQALKAAGIPPSASAAWVREVDAVAPRLAVNARAALNPASTMKLVTTYAALDLLGPAYTWKTEAHRHGHAGRWRADRRPASQGRRRSQADLRPVRTPLRMIRARGIREIRGDLVLDRSRPLPSMAPPIPGASMPSRCVPTTSRRTPCW